MRRMRIGSLAGTAFALLTLVNTRTQAAPITWDVDHAIAGGSACNAQGPFPDTWIITAGDDVSVIFSRMGVDLTPETAVNTVVHSCLVRIPVTIDPSVAIGQLDQTVYWGYAKDLGTEAQLTVKSTFFNLPTTPIAVKLTSHQQGVEGGMVTTVSDFFPNYTGLFCKPATGFFQMNLGIAARRTDPGQDISVRVAGEDIVYEALAVWVRC